MTNHSYRPVHGTNHKNLVFLDGYVNLDSSGAVVSSTLNHVAVTKTGTGQYTFTLSDPKGSVVYAAATLVAGTAVDLVAQVQSFTTSAVVVSLNTGATPTNPAAACGLLVSIHYRRSSSRAGG